jgi:hypothetical protein
MIATEIPTIKVNRPSADADWTDTEAAALRISERLMLRESLADVPATALYDAAWEALTDAGWPSW